MVRIRVFVRVRVSVRFEVSVVRFEVSVVVVVDLLVFRLGLGLV